MLETFNWQTVGPIPSIYLHKSVTLNTKRDIKQTITLILSKIITTHFSVPSINASVNETSDTLCLCLLSPVVCLLSPVVCMLSPVVWNPWQEKAAAMADLGDADYETMVCVEAGAVSTPQTLTPGHSFQAGQTIVMSA